MEEELQAGAKPRPNGPEEAGESMMAPGAAHPAEGQEKPAAPARPKPVYITMVRRTEKDRALDAILEDLQRKKESGDAAEGQPAGRAEPAPAAAKPAPEVEPAPELEAAPEDDGDYYDDYVDAEGHGVADGLPPEEEAAPEEWEEVPGPEVAEEAVGYAAVLPQAGLAEEAAPEEFLPEDAQPEAAPAEDVFIEAAPAENTAPEDPILQAPQAQAIQQPAQQALQQPAPQASQQPAQQPAPPSHVPAITAEGARQREELQKQREEAKQQRNAKRKHKMENILLEWVALLFIALVIVLVLTQVVFVNAQVPSESMEDTILSSARVLGFRLAYVTTPPERGDIAIFRYPDDEKQLYIKRVIGLPGDEVQLVSGQLYINGEKVDEPYVKGELKGDFGPFYVPKECYFMLGDNRAKSWDSRYWQMTYVRREKILGKAFFTVTPEFGPLE